MRIRSPDGRRPGVPALRPARRIGRGDTLELRGQVVEEMRIAEAQELRMRVQKLLHTGGARARQPADEEQRKRLQPGPLCGGVTSNRHPPADRVSVRWDAG